MGESGGHPLTLPPDDPALVSLIIPCFNEADTLPHLIDVLSNLDETRWGDRFEFVLVDDGSHDSTYQVLSDWADRDERVTRVRLAANRGATLASRAGQAVASGDVCIMFPADLQEGVELIDAYLEQWRAGYPVVMMVPKQGRVYDGAIDSLLASIFYSVFRWVTDLHRGLSPRARTKLMGRVTSRAFVEEASPYTPRTMWVLRQNLPYGTVQYDIKPRVEGRSKWTFKRKFSLMMEFLVEGSAWIREPWKPAGIGFGMWLVLRAATFCTPADFPRVQAWLHGFSEVILVVSVFVLLMIVGIIVARLHREQTAGPPYIIQSLQRGQAVRDAIKSLARRASEGHE